MKEAMIIRDAFAKLAAASQCRDAYVSSSRIEGLGVFAARQLSAGERFYVRPDYYRTVETINYEQIKLFDIDFFRLFQVSVDRFALPEGTVDDFFNHSCEPNCGIRAYEEGYEIVALRQIVEHDELSYDYSTHMSDLPNRLTCNCEASTCRKEVGPFSKLPRSLQRHYLSLDVAAGFVKEQPGPAVSATGQS